MKTFAALLLGLFVAASMASAATPLTGKLVALDAGHGGTETGAVNGVYQVYEKDVNLDVVLALKAKLETDGALVVLTREGDETMDSRKSRVDLAIEKCNALYGRKCDILVSVHHNGNTDPTHDGTLVIYNEKQDRPLAQALHDALIAGLGLNDEGYLNGGYGITVYGHLVSALTEAYYITNNNEAQAWRAGTRTPQEVDALYNGLVSYFSAKTGGKPRGR
ncbi:MAG: N-acetylmuramoyl-L-alanine amidase [Patescibacteria group bacterium]